MNNDESRILLVDDEPDIALAFKIGLEDNGFKVDAFVLLIFVSHIISCNC